MLRRSASHAAVVLGLLAAGCDVEALLESDEIPDIKLSISVGATSLTVAPGGTTSVTASITRLGTYTGPVTFALSGVPEDIQAEIGQQSTTGQVSTVTVTFRVSASLTSGVHFVTIRGTGTPNGAAAQQVELRVVEVPAVGVFPARQSFVVIRGGIAPLNVTLKRTNFTAPVTLSLIGAQGITASIATNPVTGTATTATISVATTVAPGTYNVTLRASASGIADFDAPISIIVSADALQLLVDDAATAQATVYTAAVTVNRFGVTDPVTLSAVGLPPGVTATFPGGAAEGTTATARLSVAASTPAGAYSVTLRGQSAGVPDALATLNLSVTPSNVAMTLVPQNVTMLQGTTAASSLQLIRTSFEGAVTIEVLSAPPGISVSPSDVTVTGTSTTLVVQAAQNVTPATYMMSIRVVPLPSTVDGPALDPIATSFGVTVVAAPIVNSNVLLDWSACGAPSWVAAQNGTGPWTRLTETGGRFAFALTSVRGGFAYSDGAGVSVRYMTSGELTAGPINLCAPPIPATHSVSGTAQHIGLADAASWRLGGGVGLSNSAVPTFTINGVRDGTHDLVGWGTTQNQTRMFIARDVNEPAGGSVGTVSLFGAGAFTPSLSTFSLSGFQGERMTLSFDYLTTAACTHNPIWETGQSFVSGSLSTAVFGVPAAYQRETDFHLVSLVAVGTNVVRTSSVSFSRTITGRQLALPQLTTVSLSTVTGSHMRLRATMPTLPADYNASMSLRFTNASQAASVTATAATLAGGIVVLDFPELGGVPGFPIESVPPPGSHGTFVVTLEGSTGEPTLCAEGASRRLQTRTGPF